MDQAAMNNLASMTRKIRGRIIEMGHKSGAAHLASSLSCVDILVSLYFSVLRIDPARPDDPGRDRCILSKGHACTTLYATLAYRGFFPESLLDSYSADGGVLAEHPGPRCVPGVEAATGSLGHGLSLGLGMAYAGRLQHRSYRVFVVMGDGECNEGSVWEAAMLGPSRHFDNVAVIIDYNKWQGTGRSEEIMAIKPLADKWRSFGWSVREIDGHDLAALTAALHDVPDRSGRPVAVVANTVKGKGVSFMQDDNNWHYRVPTAEEVAAARRELGLS